MLLLRFFADSQRVRQSLRNSKQAVRLFCASRCSFSRCVKHHICVFMSANDTRVRLDAVRGAAFASIREADFLMNDESRRLRLT